MEIDLTTVLTIASIIGAIISITHIIRVLQLRRIERLLIKIESHTHLTQFHLTTIYKELKKNG